MASGRIFAAIFVTWRDDGRDVQTLDLELAQQGFGLRRDGGRGLGRAAAAGVEVADRDSQAMERGSGEVSDGVGINRRRQDLLDLGLGGPAP